MNTDLRVLNFVKRSRREKGEVARQLSKTRKNLTSLTAHGDTDVVAMLVGYSNVHVRGEVPTLELRCKVRVHIERVCVDV